MTKQTKFILAIALQIIIILSIVFFKLYTIVEGTEVILKVRPIDPRDFLRGDYVTFQYDISNIKYNIAPKAPGLSELTIKSFDEEIRDGDNVYVILEQNGKYWEVKWVQKKKPSEDQLFIKGKVQSGGIKKGVELDDSFYNSEYNTYGYFSFYILYGIEEYFIPEGKGQNFNFQDKDVTALVAVDKNGNSVLKKIYIDGKQWP